MPVKMGRVHLLRFQASALSRELKNILRRSGAKAYYRCVAEGAATKDGRIMAVKARRQGREYIFYPKAVIDASGALIKKIKAARLNDAGKKHLGGYCFKINANCRDPLLGVKIAYALDQAVKAKTLPWYYRLTQTTIINPQAAVIKMSMPYDLAHCKAAAGDGDRLFAYLKKNISDLASARVVKRGALLERSGARLSAGHILTQGDILLGKKYLLSAAKAAWPIEFWGEKGIEYGYIQGGYYDIPYACLKAKNISNLFSCGRFIGADIKALASARVAGTCLATGEAAGKLAAQCARKR